MSLRDYLAVLHRRKWIVIATVFVMMAGAAAYSLQQEPLYRAEAEVLLNTQDATAALSGAAPASSSTEASRVIQTQADLARAPAVMAAAVQTAEVPISASAFQDQSSVTASPDSDLLEFQVDFNDPSRARDLANSYAREFVRYRETLDTASLRRARRGVEDRIRELAEAGDEESALYQKLASKSEELKVLSALQTSHAVVVKTAGTAPKVQPKPIRDLVIAGVIALIVGVGLALAWDALDTKPRSALEIAQRLGLPLLGRIPRSPFRNEGPLVMFEAPDGVEAEPFRMLRANLDLAGVDLGFQSVIVTSALQDEGKSTTIANLAIASARAGRDVVLVDLDLRRGDIGRLFGVTERYGITDVVRGAVSVGAALVPIFINDDGFAAVQGDAAVSSAERPGSLRILPTGVLPPDPGDLVLSDAVASILDELDGTGDLVVVDAPPFLQAGDALAISSLVDAVIVVARIGIRRPTLDELSRTLDRISADKLGVVVTGGTLGQGDYPGYYGPVRPPAGKRPLI
jgi:Mrp family chromosome partitioning ATPase/capsular polysaccharide biosynthesis protein